ncbi:MAG: hypothetical protein RMK91_02175 [Pseudanabaenaceae cyanobacterium SKYGB_i_bin29]|nr:hypothetical protein [Pseudanabaenaceae cyanobacterium SKYG29]MDW8420652.1 hypothetical protein [Pseudanabaenaceae cyanobacterium SKYGB_i_bin29]
MTDRYSNLIDLVKEWQSNNYQDFTQVESFFRQEILPDQGADRLRLHVEIHRLIKLIEADLSLLQASRSEENRQKYLTRLQEKANNLIALCQSYR